MDLNRQLHKRLEKVDATREQRLSMAREVLRQPQLLPGLLRIEPHKLAARAYSMESLYLLGSDFDWIRPELKGVLEVNYPSAGPAFQARARRLLNLLGKAE